MAFDSGGVTTGPMTVPFIMALGLGVSSIRSDENAAQDSFGLVALCSVGPILAVLALAMIFPASGAYSPSPMPQAADTPWPREPVDISTPGVERILGWP